MTVGLENLTAVVRQSFKALAGSCSRFLLEQWDGYLHEFASKTKLSHDEWRRGLSFWHDAAKITGGTRSEFSLAFDVFGLSSMVTLIASKQRATSASILTRFTHANRHGEPRLITCTAANRSKPCARVCASA